MAVTRVTLGVLGGFSVARDGMPLAHRLSARAEALVAYLALRPDQPSGRSSLAGLLWPDSYEEQARTNLRKALHQLRRQLPELAEEIGAAGRDLFWRGGGPCEVDACAFRSLAGLGTLAALRSAAAAYKGPLLPELEDPWVVEEREVLGREHRQVLVALVEMLESRGELREALERAETLAAVDPYAEDPYRRAFALAARLGDRGALEALWQRCTAALRELDSEPSAPTWGAYKEAASLVTARRPTVSDAKPTWGERRDAREQELLVGRGEQLERLRHWLGGAASRVLVVHGVPGVGKSALLRACARALQAQGRVHALVDGRRMPATRAGLWQALGVSSHAEALAWANDSEAVVLLDDFEDLAPLGAYLAGELMPALTDGVRLVLATRARGALPWETGSPWWELVEEMELEGLTEDEAREYLARRGIERPELAEQVLARFGSTPLALCLGADLALQRRLEPLEARPAWHETVSTLAEAWLRDVRPERLRELLFAASVVREADQELLSALAGRPVSGAEFAQLAGLDAVQVTEHGVALDGDLRRFLAEDIAWRAPERSRQARLVALEVYRRRMACAARGERERLAAEHLFLSGDAILQDLLFCPEEPWAVDGGPGGPTDIEELEEVLHTWGDQRMDTVRPAEMIAATRAIIAYRGTVLRLLRRRNDRALVGFAAAVPLCGEAIGLLLRHPGIAPYIECRWLGRRDLPETPEESRSFHFTHAAYRDERVGGTRARLIRELIGLLAGGGAYSLSTSDREYQALAETLGFRRVSEVRHTLYGRHHPCEHYELDLTEVGFAGWVDALLRPSLLPVPPGRASRH